MEFVLRTVIDGQRVWFWWTHNRLHASKETVLPIVARAAQAVDADLSYGSDAYWLLLATYACEVTLMPTAEFLGPLSALDELSQ
ncbi:hypothetical protein [Lacticaseibacillus hulanensis]|uniref:hypothetical protein n=1 Tax=Lacticaseibacillus hulanensis TaxID=2493111 RepID=UPI000FDA5920|nr:hypothetical protein [Lacticaseibacillus hulanensis]